MTARAPYADDHRERCSKCIAYTRWKLDNPNPPPLDPSEYHPHFRHALRVDAWFAERGRPGTRGAQNHSE